MPEMPEMKLKEAIRLLIEAAERDLEGGGCGVGHAVPKGEKRKQLIRAVRRAGQYVYNEWWVPSVSM